MRTGIEGETTTTARLGGGPFLATLAIALQVIGLACALTTPARPAAGLLTPVGAEFRVNSYTASYQSYPTVAVAPDGEFLVAWNSDQDGSAYGVFGQEYSSDGTPVGMEFLVNSHTLDNQRRPRALSDANGSFAVVWQSSLQDGSGVGVFGDICPATACVSDVLVNSTTVGNQSVPDAVSTAPGAGVVVWSSQGQDGSSFGVFGQRSSGMAPVGAEFQINTYTQSDQVYARIAAGPSGNFVVVWMSQNQDGSYFGVFGQRFDSSGAETGAEFQVNSYTDCVQYFPRVAMQSTSDFVVVWTTWDAFGNCAAQDGSVFGVFGQRFASGGAKIGSEFQVSTATVGSQSQADVAIGPDDEFVVVWRDEDSAIHMRQFDGLGNPIGTEDELSPNGVESDFPSIGTSPAGAVVAWAEYSPGDFDVFARRLEVEPTPTPTIPSICPNTPASGCRTPGKSLLLIKDSGSNDSLVWKWLKGPTTTPLELGSPSTTRTYGLCVYDENGSVLEAAVSPDALKWDGLSYTDAAGSQSGITKILLKPNVGPKAKVIVKGKGPNLPDPVLGAFALPVRVQLVNDETSLCFESLFGPSEVIVDTLAKFKAKVVGTPVPTATPTPLPRRMWVYSTAQDGNLGGLTGADALCQAEGASYFGASGVYKAWLSDSTTSAEARLTHGGQYVLPGGQEIAMSWAHLVGGINLTEAVHQDATGMDVTTGVWTGTTRFGTANPPEFCGDWMSNSSLSNGRIGISNSSNAAWTEWMDSACDQMNSFYCVEQ